MYKIFEGINYEVLNKGAEFEIEGIEFDSRNIKNNYVFVAMTGSLVDGHNYIDTAIEKGAKMIIVEKKDIKLEEDITYVYVENIRKNLGIIASNYYNWPQNKIKIIGVTGTNGKTTSTYILENILENTSRIGTTGHRILDVNKETTNTTPESIDLIKLLDESVKKGVEYFIMEVSSHALEIGRVEMLQFDSAIYTNLTQDHLDFHETMENYFQAKNKIFSKLRDDSSSAIVNADDLYGVRILQENKSRKNNFMSYSITDKASDIYGEVLEYNNFGMKIKIVYENKEYTFNSKLVGNYNLSNILSCVGVLVKLGIEMNDIIEKIQKIESVPGRFQLIENDKRIRVVVDFAHTEDGLINVLQTLKEMTKNKVITIFGAGGDRDKAKRKKMGIAATKYSDYIIITSDNPRNENPIDIINEIESGLKEVNFPKEKYETIVDREQAIARGIELSRENDSLLIAGKGHEKYQIIGNEKLHFDDCEIANKYIK
jgi:UDP-N-acetylmuramoyl-L-alanyl-D-glutamate--2,6-diaminopimelate ligase